MSYTIEVTEEEIKALQAMLHRACQHSGLEVAAAAAHWNQRLVQAMKEEYRPVKQNGSMRTVSSSGQENVNAGTG